MGAMKELKQEQRNGKKERGSVNNEGRLRRLLEGGNKAQGKADWSRCDPRWLQAVIAQITSSGGAVSFGYSRDGGAHSLSIFLDGDRETLWFNGNADLDTELEQVWELFGGKH